MPTLTVTIPANTVTDLTAAADELLDARKIDRTGMTVTQRGQRYVAEILKDVLISRRATSAQASVKGTLDTAAATAATDAAGITG